MGYGGCEMGYRVPEGMRARAKRIKLMLVGIDKAQIGNVSAQLKWLKWPNAYKGSGLKFRNEKIEIKKRKQQQRSK